MYRILYILIFLLTLQFARSQDTIKFRDGKIISARIVEINPRTVKYTKSDLNKDIMYEDPKENIAVIKYSNGVIDTIKSEYFPGAVRYHKIEKLGKRYFLIYSDAYKKPIGERELLKRVQMFAKESEELDILRSVRKIKWTNQNTQGLFVSGITVVALGGMFCVSSLIQYPNAYKTEADVAQIKKDGIIIGLSALAIGVGLETLAVKSFRRKKRKLSEVVERYNNYLNSSTSLH